MENLILSNFVHEIFGEIRITDVDGTIWFVANDVAKSLGYEKPNNAINRYCKKVNKFNYPVTGRELNIIPESDVYKLIMRSELPEAEKFQDWVTDVVLPTIRKTGSYSLPQVKITRTEAFELELIGLKYAAEILNMSESSKLGLVHKTYQSHNVPATVLPEYVKAERVHFSASKLLEDHGKPLSAMAFNQLMIANGFLEEKTRPSSNGSTKTFKFLTDKSENFGLNLVSPKNDKETQPHYYEDSFSDLLKLLLNQE